MRQNTRADAEPASQGPRLLGRPAWGRLACLLAVLSLVLALPSPAGAAEISDLAAPTGQACAPPPPAVVDAVLRATDGYMLERYAAVYGSACVLRVVGDWALVVVTARVPADRAALVLHRLPGLGWTIAAGPGTAFPPGARPAGMPDDLLDMPSACA